MKDHLQIRALVFNIDSLFGKQGREPDGGGEDDYDVHLNQTNTNNNLNIWAAFIHRYYHHETAV